MAKYSTRRRKLVKDSRHCQATVSTQSSTNRRRSQHHIRAQLFQRSFHGRLSVTRLAWWAYSRFKTQWRWACRTSTSPTRQRWWDSPQRRSSAAMATWTTSFPPKTLQLLTSQEVALETWRPSNHWTTWRERINNQQKCFVKHRIYMLLAKAVAVPLATPQICSIINRLLVLKISHRFYQHKRLLRRKRQIWLS